MSLDRHRVQEDLRGIVAGDVLCNETIADLYAADAGPFHIRPLGVVRPRHTQDVVELVNYAAAHQLSLHARGAATSCAGQSLGSGIVVDFSRFMRRVLGNDEKTVTIEPGLPVGQLNRMLAKDNRALGFDPWSNGVATLGGIIAGNATSRYATGFGLVADHLVACEVVLADGSAVELSVHRLEPDLRGSVSPRIQQLVRRVANTLMNQRGPSPSPGRPVPFSGYALDGVLGAESIALAKLLAGSEGTLGLITRATLRTTPLPPFACILPLFFDRIERAAEAALLVRPHQPDACDLLDRRHLTIVREADLRYEVAVPSWAEAVLLVEKNADDASAAAEQLRHIANEVRRELDAVSVGDLATDSADVRFYRHLADAAPRLLHRIGGHKRPVALADELIVPPERLRELIRAAQSLLQRTGVTASIFAHAQDGQMQLKPFLDLTTAEGRGQAVLLSESIAEMVWELGGVLGGNAACGLLCGSRYPRSDAGIPDMLREIKREFDAEGLLNPGKVVPTTPFTLDRLLPPLPRGQAELRRPERESLSAGGAPYSAGTESERPDAAQISDNGAGGLPTLITPEFGWSGVRLLNAAAKCSGCGVCRAEQDVRMCPINHIAPREEASPRAKANLVRGLLAETADGKHTEESEFKAVADLCVQCHMCRLECPAEVDIPHLVVEAKAQHVRTNGLRLSDWLMAHIDGLAGFSRRIRHLSNWALGNPVARWLLEKGTGIARNRRLPTLGRRPFLEEARRKRLTIPTSGQEKVAFFLDTYVNHFDAELGLALTAVLEHNQVAVWVPPTQRHAGMPMIVRGALDPARDVARHNTALLAEAIRQGYTIVATEPSAVLALTREYLFLLPDDSDAQSVAEHTVEACHYLWQLHQRQRLRLDFKRLDATLGYHAPCHLLALGVGTPAENLLRLVPGLHVERLEYGCSGIAGTYGLQQKNYRNSLRAGLRLMTALRKMPLTAGATECSTCRIQMQHGTDRPTIHPVKILALAYGLMPELKRHLFSGGKELTLQ
jgi:Fe-S oxidoreductase/FAD/FMN-containing dehydrogenase